MRPITSTSSKLFFKRHHLGAGCESTRRFLCSGTTGSKRKKTGKRCAGRKAAPKAFAANPFEPYCESGEACGGFGNLALQGSGSQRAAWQFRNMASLRARNVHKTFQRVEKVRLRRPFPRFTPFPSRPHGAPGRETAQGNLAQQGFRIRRTCRRIRIAFGGL